MCVCVCADDMLSVKLSSPIKQTERTPPSYSQHNHLTDIFQSTHDYRTLRLALHFPKILIHSSKYYYHYFRYYHYCYYHYHHYHH